MANLLYSKITLDFLIESAKHKLTESAKYNLNAKVEKLFIQLNEHNIINGGLKPTLQIGSLNKILKQFQNGRGEYENQSQTKAFKQSKNAYQHSKFSIFYYQF